MTDNPLHWALFDRFEIAMHEDDARAMHHQGACDEDVERYASGNNYLARQLNEIDSHTLAAELREYGAWDETELADCEQNKRRILWLAAGNITEELDSAK